MPRTDVFFFCTFREYNALFISTLAVPCYSASPLLLILLTVYARSDKPHPSRHPHCPTDTMIPISQIFLFCVSFILLATESHAWVSPVSTFARPHKVLKSTTKGSADNVDMDDLCWQDIWNYDCAMSNIYSAAFVAADWVRSLPCASGLVDCDAPEELKMPGPSGSGVENVDVMSYLNIKRAKPLQIK